MSENPSNHKGRPAASADAGQTPGYVSEVFCSLQGEGPYVGERQIFFRTAGCSETCSWCDTVYSKVRTPRCVIRGRDGRAARTLPNPLTVDLAVGVVLKVAEEHPGTRVVSITGGEPLEQSEFVTALAARLASGGLSVYLETNGNHDLALSGILPFVDVVAMDIKLPSAVDGSMWNEHSAFLSRIEGTAFDPDAAFDKSNQKHLFVKVVVDERSCVGEIETAARLIASTNRRIPLVIQPESGTYLSAGGTRLNGMLSEFREAASCVLDDVRVMPQVHKILNIR